MQIELEKAWAENLADFIGDHLIDVVRADDCIDNIGWLESLILARAALLRALEG